MSGTASPSGRVRGVLEKHFPGREPELVRLAGDASTRQYFRCRLAPGESVIAVVYDQPIDPEHFSYRQVDRLFRHIGLPTPRILATEPGPGIVLQEDLGDQSLQARLEGCGGAERRRWLLRALDLVVTLQREGAAALQEGDQAGRWALDAEKLLWELNFFSRHYLGSLRGLEVREPERLEAEFGRISRELDRLPRVLCHRDYQVRNLMIREEALCVIDFQDARWGPFCYDPASLLKDSVDLEPEEIDSCLAYYLERTNRPRTPELERQFQVMCIQRLLKALGTYGHQIAVLGRENYRRYVRGSLRRVLLSLEAVPEFPYIQSIVEEDLGSGEPDRN